MSRENPEGGKQEADETAAPVVPASKPDDTPGDPEAAPAVVEADRPEGEGRRAGRSPAGSGEIHGRPRKGGRGVRVEGNLEKAIRQFRKKVERQGLFRELRKRRFFEKPSERRKRKLREADKRRRKKARQ